MTDSDSLTELTRLCAEALEACGPDVRRIKDHVDRAMRGLPEGQGSELRARIDRALAAQVAADGMARPRLVS